MKPHAFLLLLLAGLPLHADDQRTTALRPLAREYCTACHNAEKTEGEMDLDALLAEPDKLWSDGKLLELLRDVVRDGDMPPKKAKKKLGDEERARLAGLFDGGLVALATSQQDDPGLVVMPRLAKHEYRNVLRDLSGGVLRTAGEYLPNEGGAGEGFANVGEAQSMSPAALEKYLEAAKGALRHLRVSPRDGLVWSAVPHDAVDEPAAARQEAIDDLIAWHVAQQTKWGRSHREDLEQRLGFSDAAYLEAAWRYRWRTELGKPDATFADIARGYEVPLAPVVLEKWFAILSAPEPKEPFAAWAKAWQALPRSGDFQSPSPARAGGAPSVARAAGPVSAGSARSAQAAMGDWKSPLRERCIAIVSGKESEEKPSGLQPEGYAPPYEVSFQEAVSEVLMSANEKGVWPFRIAVGDAKELFFVVTDAGDGSQGEFAVWRVGRFQMSDGTAKAWQDVSKVTGVNSGRDFPFGKDHDGRALPPDSIGVRPPGALRVSVPPGAVTFELELALAPESFGKSSVQAIVLKEKPKSQNYIPGRMVFGGKKSVAREAQADTQSKELERALRRRNIAEANVTKIGLSAERNVLADWKRTPLEALGGPWPTHVADKEEPLAPYHLTVVQVRRNATEEDRAVLQTLEDRLFALAQPPPADVLEARAKEWLSTFATRAWRRPLAAGEVETLLDLYRAAAAQGVSFDSAMKSPLMLVLASPHFVYRGGVAGRREGEKRRRRDGGKERQREEPVSPSLRPSVPLSSSQLATRLSFFLWASIPDDELLALAAADKLRDPDTLRAQVRRMLRDPRAQSLATDFAGQLWDFAGFEHFTGPDGKRFKEFTPALRQAMLDEVTHFLADLITHDRPLTALLDADYTFVNRELARQYGLVWEEGKMEGGGDGEKEGKRDSEGRNLSISPSLLPSVSPTLRLSVPPQRGGLAGMALFLTKTSLPLRTSPVQRGVWVMEKVLGRELAVPPPVNPISEDEKDASGLNIRQQLEKHRADPSCASCHDKIDPLGIALEHYDAIGRWRATERDGSPLAASAISHDGVPLDGPAGLKMYLLTRQDEFFRHFTRKLLGYALGRAVLPGDKALLDRMNASLKSDGYKFSALAEAIVTSPQFTTRRADAVAATSNSK
jgi:hypothetical protein